MDKTGYRVSAVCLRCVLVLFFGSLDPKVNLMELLLDTPILTSVTVNFLRTQDGLASVKKSRGSVDTLGARFLRLPSV
jgi:hypothetical protein